MSIFKAYDVRGIYNKEFSDEKAYLIGYYLAKMKNIKECKIAHDSRISHKSLSVALMKGLTDANVEVTYQGYLSTPNFYHSLFEGCKTGILVTASHNSKEYNGFKIMLDLESFDTRNGLKELGEIVEKDKENRKEIYQNMKDKLLTFNLENFERTETLEKYIDYLKKKYDELLTEEEQNKIKEIDCSFCFSSGMTSQAVKPLIKEKMSKAKFLLDELDGNFPEFSPDPPNAKTYLKKQENKGEFTIVYDGDGDRIGIYDKETNYIQMDIILGLFIDFFADETNNNFVCDLRGSRTLEDIAKEKNIHLEKMRVGRAFYQDYMRKNGCVFGGELSGHLFFKEFNYLDNPDIATIFFLKILAQMLLKGEELNIIELEKKYSHYFKLEEINIKLENSDEKINLLREKYKEHIISQIDGVSFDLIDTWFNIRKSNTEPLVRLTLEGENKEKVSKRLEELKIILH